MVRRASTLLERELATTREKLENIEQENKNLIDAIKSNDQYHDSCVAKIKKRVKRVDKINAGLVAANRRLHTILKHQEEVLKEAHKQNNLGCPICLVTFGEILSKSKLL